MSLKVVGSLWCSSIMLKYRDLKEVLSGPQDSLSETGGRGGGVDVQILTVSPYFSRAWCSVRPTVPKGG